MRNIGKGLIKRCVDYNDGDKHVLDLSNEKRRIISSEGTVPPNAINFTLNSLSEFESNLIRLK